MSYMEKVILVDKNDNQIGLEDKLKAHLGQGILHRAFSVFVFNSKGELLLQQRASEKMLWPLFWTNTCCSHPREGEGYEEGGQRRLKEELGFTCPLEYKGKIRYQASYEDIGSENELCPVLVGEYNGEVLPNKEEVNNFKWVNFDELKKDVSENPDKYTPWLKMELEQIFNK